MIRLEAVERQFAGRALFSGLSWGIPAQARLGLVGPNGAGKTTLLRLLANRDRPDAGSVHVPRGATVGYLPQEVETVQGGTVLETVLAGAGELRQLQLALARTERELGERAATDPCLPELTRRYGELRARYEQLDGDQLDARARAMLSGLGVPGSRFGGPLEVLSGGWRMRVVLARLLLAAPSLLLLDEPTNHLDLEAIGWLEEFLDGYPGAFVVVSHDRYFLNRMVGGIVELDRGRLTPYTGNYDEYLEAKDANRDRLAQQARRQAREIARVERFIERFRYKNTKARQVQSRIRSLGKVERLETEQTTRTVHFGFPPAPRSGDIVVRVENVSKSFGERVVYRSANLQLRRGDRVALIGPNGAGKSTLLKLLAGSLPPDDGVVEQGHGVIHQLYAQHQLEALDPELTALEEFAKTADPDQRPRLRSLLGKFLFRGDDVDKKVCVLSGGEKARLALAKLLLRPANLLLLDEPTNHLDLGSREVLEDALDEYGGTLVVVSHDRYFINRIATAVVDVDGGRLERYEGDYDEFLDWRARHPAAVSESAADDDGSRKRRRDERRQEAERRNREYRARRDVERQLGPIEAEIAAGEARVRELTEQQGDPDVYSDPERARHTARARAEAEQQLAQLYGRWEELAAQLEP